MPVKLLLRIVLFLALISVLLVAINYLTLPSSNTAATHFDTILVLGTPANEDGTISLEQRERALEGVREYKAGVAPAIIMTGGAAHNRYIEANVMREFALAQGVPASAVIEEPQAQNTIQNVFYSAEIMHQHGWHSAEVVSSPTHLPRAGFILTTFDRLHPELAIDWRTQAAPWPDHYGLRHRIVYYILEAGYCMRLRLLGFPHSRFLPAQA